MDLFVPHGAIKSTSWPVSRKNLFYREYGIKSDLPLAPAVVMKTHRRTGKITLIFVECKNKIFFVKNYKLCGKMYAYIYIYSSSYLTD